MIFDSIKNSRLYTGLSAEFRDVFEFINKNDMKDAAAGRYEMKNGVYYLVQEYDTKPEQEGIFEAHRKYIDVQFIISGRELHKYANISAMKDREPYNDEKDVILFNGSGFSFILEKSYFAIYFPEDAHMPNLSAGASAVKNKKAVFKIPFGAMK